VSLQAGRIHRKLPPPPGDDPERIVGRLLRATSDPESALGFVVLFREDAAPAIESGPLAAAHAASVPVVVDTELYELLRGPRPGAHALTLIDTAKGAVRASASLPDCVAMGLEDMKRATAALSVLAAFPMLTVPASWRIPPLPTRSGAGIAAVITSARWPGLAGISRWFGRKDRPEGKYLATTASDGSSLSEAAVASLAPRVDAPAALRGKQASAAAASSGAAAASPSGGFNASFGGSEATCATGVDESTPYLARWVPEDMAQKWFPGDNCLPMPSHKVYLRPVRMPWDNQTKLAQLSASMQATIVRMSRAGTRATRLRKGRVLESMGLDVPRVEPHDDEDDPKGDGKAAAQSHPAAAPLPSPWGVSASRPGTASRASTSDAARVPSAAGASAGTSRAGSSVVTGSGSAPSRPHRGSVTESVVAASEAVTSTAVDDS